MVEDTYGTQRIWLQAGSMVLYSSSSLHRVEPITSGKRDVIVFWVHSMVRDASQRALLYKFDRSIRKLRERDAACPEIDPLIATLSQPATHVG